MNAEVGIYTVWKRSANLIYAKYKIVAETAGYTVTYNEATLKLNKSISADTSTSFLEGIYATIYRTTDPAYLIDTIAASAPYPSPDFFVPIMNKVAPVHVHPPREQIADNEEYLGYYDGYYNTTTRTWNDSGFQQQYPGQTIPVDLKKTVSDAEYLYDQYLILNDLWNTEYTEEKTFQWPYYWAKQIIARK